MTNVEVLDVVLVPAKVDVDAVILEYAFWIDIDKLDEVVATWAACKWRGEAEGEGEGGGGGGGR